MSNLSTLELPKEIAEELSRLHKILICEEIDGITKDWAREKIDNIHKIFFCGMIFIPENNEASFG